MNSARTVGASVMALALMGWAGAASAAPTRTQQPHMEIALTQLQNARAQLNQAAHDKGGHRVRALQLVDQAINEVKQGTAAGAVAAEQREMHRR